MLQNFRAGDVAFLGDVADQDDRDACLLGESQEYGGDFLDLGDRAGSRINSLREHCLDRVHNHQVRFDITSLRDHVLNQCLTVDLTVGGITAQAVGAHLDLPQAFLTGDIEGLEGRAAKRNLERKSGLAYSRLTTDQDQGTFHNATTEDPVNLLIVQRKPDFGT